MNGDNYDNNNSNNIDIIRMSLYRNLEKKTIENIEKYLPLAEVIAGM
jgi:hypothetical protein